MAVGVKALGRLRVPGSVGELAGGDPGAVPDELHRLATTASKAEGVSGALAADETAKAASFADDLYALGVKVGLW